MFDYDVTEGEYLSFFRRKNELHVEMDELTDLSQSKVRQVVFKILEQSGMIDSIRNKVIQPQLLDDKLVTVIAADSKKWLKVLFMSDMDIENIKGKDGGFN